MSSATHFKLSKLDGLTRRVSFPHRPSWEALAAKIQLLYNLPLDRIAVSYLDADGDEVTLSSEEELREFYETTPSQSLIKFNVLDLGSLRATLDENKPLPATPQASSSRNTFGGGPLIFEVEDDWERLGAGPIFTSSPPGPGLDSPHAYVETVDSDGSGSSREEDKGSMSSSDYGELIGTSADKGKGIARDLRPAVEDDVSSSASVLDDDTPTKHPIHVQVRGLRGASSDTFGAQFTPSPTLQSHADLPKASPSDRTAHTPVVSPGSEKQGAETEADDPPLPDVSAADVPSPTASLTNDIASLLNSLSTVFASHPELSEGLRNVLRNATNGTYWAAHRDSVARAAEEIRRAAQEVQNATVASARDAHRAAEEEAGRRVTEAIGNIFRALGEATSNPNSSIPSGSVPNPPQPIPGPASLPPILTSAWNLWSQPRSAPVPQPSSILPQAPPNAYPPMTSMPPPAGAYPPGAIPPPGTYVPAWSHFRPYPHPPASTLDPPLSSIPPSEPPEVSYYGASPRSRPRASELRASLEVAKEHYKAEKDRYRREREFRRKLREQRQKESTDSATVSGVDPFKAATSEATERPADANRQVPVQPPPRASGTTTPPSQIISNARGNFPQLEMFSLPRSPRSPRKQNASGGTNRDHTSENQTRQTERQDSMKDLVGRLGDMGFTESAFPSLPKMVDSRLPSDGKRLSKAEEEDVVNYIVDKLLTSDEQAKSPRPSGSGAKDV
ncbi:hypothetical protein DENSPDRAFT_833147, partial [Dentipellis sp. KUC8613]